MNFVVLFALLPLPWVTVAATPAERVSPGLESALGVPSSIIAVSQSSPKNSSKGDMSKGDMVVESASQLPVMTMNGATFDLNANHGWRVIYFWSGECPCVQACERYSLVPLAQKYKGLVSFYAVAANGFDLHTPRAQIRSIVASRHLPFPVLLDPPHKVVAALGAVVTPQAFLLDPQGRVLFSGVPDDSRRYLARTGRSGMTRSYLGRALQEALAGVPVTQPQVKDQGCIITW